MTDGKIHKLWFQIAATAATLLSAVVSPLAQAQPYLQAAKTAAPLSLGFASHAAREKNVSSFHERISPTKAFSVKEQSFALAAMYWTDGPEEPPQTWVLAPPP